MKELNIEIITPSRIAYSGKVISVSVPGTLGNFQVLFNHAPILSSFEVGTVKIVEPNNEARLYSTSGGTIEVLENKILILAESLESPEEIDIERARKSLERAKERLSIKKVGDIDSIRAEASLQRAINRLKLTGNYSSN